MEGYITQKRGQRGTIEGGKGHPERREGTSTTNEDENEEDEYQRGREGDKHR